MSLSISENQIPKVIEKPKEKAKSTPIISACMIVRDEEKNLPRCLKSILNFVDEIIIVDTGSTDKTIEIAKQYGCTVYEQEWKEDFSYHRNYSISKARGDWIFIIDADEEVYRDHGSTFMGLYDDINKYDVVIVEVANLYGEHNTPKSLFNSLRFFKRATKPRYDGRVHNRPVISGNAKGYRIPFRINHYGYNITGDEAEKKYKRTVNMCRRWKNEEPESQEAWLQYARALKVRHGKPNEKAYPLMYDALEKGLAISYGTNGTTNKQEESLHVQMLGLMAWLSYADQRHEDAVYYCKKALKIRPDYLDAMFTMSCALTIGISALEGEVAIKKYLEEQEKFSLGSRDVDGLVMEHTNERILAYQLLIDIEKWKEKNNAKTL